jgi:diadenosine tetraphosphate (Ap4A) HIT family hydrolase
VPEPCFVCGIVRGSPSEPERILHRDRIAVTFLARPGVAPGHTLVAPVRHVEAVVGDFPVADYLDLQRRVHEVGLAVCAAVPSERLQVLSLGGRGDHVHWHVVPVPPGVPPLGLADRGVSDLLQPEQVTRIRTLLFR